MRNITITTSIDLSQAQLESISASLEKKYGPVKIAHRIDESIIAGIVLFDGEVVYDGSIRKQLEIVRENFRLAQKNDTNKG